MRQSGRQGFRMRDEVVSGPFVKGGSLTLMTQTHSIPANQGWRDVIGASDKVMPKTSPRVRHCALSENPF